MSFFNRKIILFIVVLLLLILTQTAMIGWAQRRPQPIRCTNTMPSLLANDGHILASTKIHEASHAVTALAYGGQVNSITVFRPGRAQCDCFVDDLNQMGVVYAAGYAGEMFKYSSTLGGHGADFSYAQHYGYPAGPRVPTATAILRDRWAAVIAIANALPNKGTLSGDAIRSLYQNSLNNNGLLSRGSSGSQDAERTYQNGGQSWLQWWDSIWEENGATEKDENRSQHRGRQQQRQGNSQHNQSQRRGISGWDGSSADCQRRGGIYYPEERSCHFH